MDTKGKALRAADVLRNLFIDDDEPLGALDADGANTPIENADGSATFEMSGLVYQPGAQPAKHRGGSYGEPLGRVVYTVTVKCDFVPFDGELASTV